MPNLSRRFDPYMSQVNADKLKKMVRTYTYCMSRRNFLDGKHLRVR